MNLKSKEFNTIKKRGVIKGKARAMIARVYHFLQDEYSFLKQFNIDKCNLSPLAKITKRTAKATGVSENTVVKILREEKLQPLNSNEFVNPMAKRKPRPSKLDVDEQTLADMHSVIQNYQKEFHECPTLTRLNEIFKERFQFNVCLGTFRVMLMKMGYKWTRTANNKIQITLKSDWKNKKSSKGDLPTSENSLNPNTFCAEKADLIALK